MCRMDVPSPCRSSARTLAALLVSLCSAGLLGAAPLAAQRIAGRVLASETRAPIELATVVLLSGEGKSLHVSTTTDTAGAFVLYLQKAGSYRLQVKRVGFKPIQTAPLEVTGPELVTVEVLLGATAVALAPVEITGRAPIASSRLDGFHYRRQRDLGGTFLTREEIDQRNTYQFSHLLGMIPAVRLEQTTDGFPRVYMTRALSGGKR